MKYKYILPSLIALTILPVFIFTDIPRYDYFDSDIFSIYIGLIGSMIGLIGGILLWWQYILGIRGITSKIVKDLIYVNKIHKNIGIYGFLFIMLHPLLIAYSYGSKWMDILIPSIPKSEFSEHVMLGIFAFLILSVIWITSALFRSRLKYRLWKFIHYSNYLILPLVFVHSNEIGSVLGSTKELQLYWIVMISTWFSALVYRALFYIGFIGRSKYTLESIEQVAPLVNKYNFMPLGKPLLPSPGQFIYVQKDLTPEEHPFTVSHFNEANGMLSLTIKASGKFTNALQNIQRNSIVLLDGPYGVFTKDAFESSRDIVLIAGGIGITPFVRLVEKLTPSRNIFLFNCNKMPEDIVFETFLESRLTKEKVINIFSAMKSVPSNLKNTECGFMNTKILKKYLGEDLTKFDFFVCGPPVMMKMVNKDLKAEKVPSKQIFMEKFSL